MGVRRFWVKFRFGIKATVWTIQGAPWVGPVTDGPPVSAEDTLKVV